jgi:hypothetical protein
VLTRDNIIDQDRDERETYKKAAYLDEVPLPLTRDGFEAILEIVCRDKGYPLDDAMRQVLAGYVHHIPNEQDTVTLEKLRKIMHKSIANATTWQIDQEIKQKRIEEAKQAAEKAKAEKDNVVNMTPRPTPGPELNVPG